MVTKAQQARTGAAPHPLVVIALVLVFALAVINAQRIAALLRADVETHATLGCPRPSEFETLLIFVNVDAYGRYTVKCGPAAGAGAYTRRK